eukprot:1217872-Rhodomonas_salina.1
MASVAQGPGIMIATADLNHDLCRSTGKRLHSKGFDTLLRGSYKGWAARTGAGPTRPRAM